MNIDLPNSIDIHFDEKGLPILSMNGVIIAAYHKVVISAEIEDFNKATIECAVNLRHDDSHIITNDENKKPHYELDGIIYG